LLSLCKGSDKAEPSVSQEACRSYSHDYVTRRRHEEFGVQPDPGSSLKLYHRWSGWVCYIAMLIPSSFRLRADAVMIRWLMGTRVRNISRLSLSGIDAAFF